MVSATLIHKRKGTETEEAKNQKGFMVSHTTCGGDLLLSTDFKNSHSWILPKWDSYILCENIYPREDFKTYFTMYFNYRQLRNILLWKPIFAFVINRIDNQDLLPSE